MDNSYAIQKARRNRETAVAVENAVKILSQAINVMGADDVVAKALFDAICKEHRTLQQGIWRAIGTAAAQYADLQATGYYDARNEGAVRLCVAMKPVIETHPLPFI